jgi:hypothetical protein
MAPAVRHSTADARGLHLDVADPADDVSWPLAVARARDLLEQAAWTLPFPADAEAIAVTLLVRAPGQTGDSVEVVYLALRPLEPQAAEVLGSSLRRAVGHQALRTAFVHAGPVHWELDPGLPAALDSIGSLARRYPGLRVAVRSHQSDSTAAASITASLRSAGVQWIEAEARPDPGTVELRMGRPVPIRRTRG